MQSLGPHRKQHLEQRARGSLRTVHESVRFFRHFVTSPHKVGAVAPSSRWLAERMLEGLDIERAETIVELGPGTGVFTRAISRRVAPTALFMTVEFNAQFASALRNELPLVDVVHASAETLGTLLLARGRQSADCIVSSLPWVNFPRDMQERLISRIADALRPGGYLTTFAYVPAAWLPPGRRLRELLEAHFESVQLSPIEWRNVPPAFVYRCRKALP